MSNRVALMMARRRADAAVEHRSAFETVPMQVGADTVIYADNQIQSLEHFLEQSYENVAFKQRQLEALTKLALDFGIRAEEIQDVLDATK